MYNRRYDSQQNVTRHNDTQHNCLICDIHHNLKGDITSLIIIAKRLDVECCIFILSVVMLNVITKFVVILSVVAPFNMCSKMYFFLK